MTKFRLGLFLLVFFLLPALVTARDTSDISGDTFEERTGTGLEIHTNPRGVRVFINGADSGITPVLFDYFIPGSYHIKLTREGYNDRDFTITTFETSRLIISIEMEEQRGLVLVSIHKAPESPDSLPLVPQIFSAARDDSLNHAAFNNDSTILLNLPIGFNTIRTRAFGWEDEVINIFVTGIDTVKANITMKPADFILKNVTQSRRRFNPSNSGNLGITEYRFEVSAPGSGTITILNSNNSVVYTSELEPFTTWVQHIRWDGRDLDGNLLPQGSYTVVIEASGLTELNQDEIESITQKIITEINNSINIFPLSLESGVAGLALTPMPHVLAVGSYQFNAGLMYCSSGFPFKINMRITPFERFELTTVLNINPSLQNQTGWGLSGSAKYNFLSGSGSVPLAFATALSYAWASETGEYPLSPGKGAGLYAPFSLELTKFSFVICPAAFWHGPEGLVPQLLLGGGILYRGTYFTGGVSVRGEFDFQENNIKFLASAETQIFPPPANLVFSLYGGMWAQSSKIGGYGGLGIGLIY